MTPHREHLVPCTNLYHYRRQGWRLDLSYLQVSKGQSLDWLQSRKERKGHILRVGKGWVVPWRSRPLALQEGSLVSSKTPQPGTSSLQWLPSPPQSH